MENVVGEGSGFRRLLITGATGFVGSRLVRGFLDSGVAVGALLRAESSAEHLDPRATILRHDGSTSDLHALTQTFAPEAAIHAATHFVGAHRPDDIVRLIRANLLFGTQLLDAMGRCGIRNVVNFGTSWQHFDGDRYNPATLYAATKQAFEDIAAYYAEADGFSILTLKLPDTYGPADRRGKLVSALLRARAEGQSLDLSPGEQRINLLHIDDVFSAVCVALGRAYTMPAGTRETFALRGPETVSLRELVARIQRVGGRPVPVAWGARPYRSREVMQPWVGPLLPGWSAHIGLDRGLTELIETA